MDDEGVFRAGFMYWSVQNLYSTPYEFVLLGVVAGVDEQPEIAGELFTPCRGRISIEEVVLCPERFRESALTIRSVECDALHGLAPGDRVLIFMVPYEGEYAIPKQANSNCLIGFQEPEVSEGLASVFDSFVELLRSGRGWHFDSHRIEEREVWGWVYPKLKKPVVFKNKYGPQGLVSDEFVRVFGHTCEHSRLHGILEKRHVLAGDAWGQEEKVPASLCVVGDFGFEQALMYLELYPAPGANQLWVLEGSPHAGIGKPLNPVIHMEISREEILVRSRAEEIMHVEWIEDREVRLFLELQDGELIIFQMPRTNQKGVSDRRVLVELATSQKVFLALPCIEDPASECGLVYLEIYLPETIAKSWQDEVGMGSWGH